MILHPKKYSQAIFLNLAKKLTRPYRGGTVARTARDLRLPQVPEAPVDTHRPREATAVDSAELPRPLLFLLAQILLLGPTRSWPTFFYCHWLIRGRLSQKKTGGLGRVGGVGWLVGSQ